MNTKRLERNIEMQAPTDTAKVREQAKLALKKGLENRWQSKALHRKYMNRLNDPDIDAKMYNKWLQGSGLKGQSGRFIIAAPDQGLLPNANKEGIIKDGSDPVCRVCPVVAENEYIIRHDRVGKYIH